MTPRHLIVNKDAPCFYHCISRCVRRAYLCGEGFDHRRDWIAERLRELTGILAIDVVAYAVLSNHFHVILWTDPERAKNWSRREVAVRWIRLFPKKNNSGRTEEQEIKILAGNTKRIEVLRARLSDLSWFMRCLKEDIARRANREDDCTGCFWESRFKSHILLDEAAVLACCVYVDLNLIRAGLARTIESSVHTSIRDRIHVLQRFQKLIGARLTSPSRAEKLVHAGTCVSTPDDEEEGIWLTPIQARHGEKRRGALGIDLQTYIELAQATARVAMGEAAAMKHDVTPTLSRIGIDAECWVEALRGVNRMVGTAIGSVASLVNEAARRKRRRVVAVFDVYGD